MNKNFEIADFIVAFVKGNSTQEQINGLAVWLEESESNRKFFISLLNGATYEKELRDYHKDEWEEAFKRVKIRVLQKQAQKRRIHFYYGVASVSIMMVIMGILVFGLGKESNDVVKSDRLISVGKKNAYLTLGSGDRVVLGRQDTLLEVKAINIHVSEKEVVYCKIADSLKTKEPEYNMIETPQGTEFQVVLADGTKVWLNAGSKLWYPVNFVGNERRVRLVGEAYFDVVLNDEMPFVVGTSRADIWVHGTEFCVRDYLGQENLTTLVSGSVSVHKHGGKTYSIKPGQQVSILGDSVRIAEVETIYFTSWKDGYFIFNQATLEEIIDELSKWYDFDYFFVNNATASIRLTAKMKKYDDVNLVLDMLSRTGNVFFSSKGRILIIESNGL